MTETKSLFMLVRIKFIAVACFMHTYGGKVTWVCNLVRVHILQSAFGMGVSAQGTVVHIRL